MRFSAAPPCAKETPMPDPRSNEELREALAIWLRSGVSALDSEAGSVLDQALYTLDELARRLAQAEEALANPVGYVKDLRDTVAAVRHANDTLERRLAQAEKALFRYGEHETVCDRYDDHSKVCSCGLQAALHAVGGEDA
jgi:hypothetical protein